MPRGGTRDKAVPLLNVMRKSSPMSILPLPLVSTRLERSSTPFATKTDAISPPRSIEPGAEERICGIHVGNQQIQMRRFEKMTLAEKVNKALEAWPKSAPMVSWLW